MDVAGALELGSAIITMIDDELPDWARDNSEEFFASVYENVTDVLVDIEQNDRVTDPQAEALHNWYEGVSRWIP